MKKIISFVLVFIIIISFAPVTASANDDILNNNISKFNWLPTNEEALGLVTLPFHGIESDHPEIIAKALEITAGLKTDYEKARAIHIWVATNTWYDNDLVSELMDEKNETLTYTRRGDFSPIESESALAVLRNRRAICVGYADLTVALLRAVEIPSVIASSNGHEWYHAFVDGRWIIGDSTWDSYNLFENGRSSPRRNGGTDWFDVSIEDLSQSSDHEMDIRNFLFFVSTVDFYTTVHKTIVHTTLTVSRTEVLLITVIEARIGYTTEVVESSELIPAIPQIINGRTMVPMRVIFEALGADVDWTTTHDGIQQIDAYGNGINLSLMIGHPLGYNAIVGGELIVLDQGPVIVGGLTYVPLRFVGEALGVEVQWLGV